MDYHKALRMLGQYYYHEHGANSYARTSEEFRTIAKVVEALDIIKEKKVNLEYLKSCENYEQYKTICSYWNEITETEFNLLKEVIQ